MTYLKGVGPQRAQALAAELGIRTYGDLLQHYPFRYIDRSVIYGPGEALPGPAEIQIRGVLNQIQTQGGGAKKRLTAQLVSPGGSIELVWFKGLRWVEKSLLAGSEYVAFGRLTEFSGRKSMAHPELDTWASFEQSLSHGLFPVYSTTEKLSSMGLHSRGLSKLVQSLLADLPAAGQDWLPEGIWRPAGWPPHLDALREMHFPQSATRLAAARERLAFEEIFLDQLVFAYKRRSHATQLGGLVFQAVGSYFHHFYAQHLPFELTGAQKRVLKEIRKDTASGLHMNRLVQGDVGSGKTMVAFMALLIAMDNGYQGCLMAPTEILAQQHYQGLLGYAESLGIRIGLLTGSVKTAARKVLLNDLATGQMHLLVGTHAVLEDPVVFHRLGMAIVDEQHRFGVAERMMLQAKGKAPPHLLAMTATPIPRTLAMSAYADLDTSILDELPPGRTPVNTVLVTDSRRVEVIERVRGACAEGRQAYWVCTLIEESEELTCQAAETTYEDLTSALGELKVGLIHGRMKPAEKAAVMAQFKAGDLQLLVATTVIEVGVDVPNASLMIIENPERLGLAQLHQLRGRVGRGSAASHCVLLYHPPLSQIGRQRLGIMRETNDGFVIAEKDLELRGPGEMLGTRQTGLLQFKVADLMRDADLLPAVRDAAQALLERWPDHVSPLLDRWLRHGQQYGQV